MSRDQQRLRTVRRSPFWWFLSRSTALLVSRLWFRLSVENPERLPADGPVLLVANHTSYLDPAMLGITCNRWVGFLAQAGLARFAPMRWWLGQLGVTLIDRHAPSKAAMRLIADCLKAGEVVCLFPEGTRSDDGSIAPFRNGVEFLVRRTKAMVVPVGIDGASRAFPRGAWIPRPRKIIVRYGEALTAEQVLAEGGVELLRRQVGALSHCKLQGDDPESGGGAAQVPQSGCGAAQAMVDPSDSPADSTAGSSSTSASAGGGA